MTEAYDRIWAGVRTDEFRGMVLTKIRVWGNDPRVGTDDPAIEYIRADLVAEMLAEERAEGWRAGREAAAARCWEERGLLDDAEILTNLIRALPEPKEISHV